MMYAYDEDKPWTSVGHRILATLWRVRFYFYLLYFDKLFRASKVSSDDVCYETPVQGLK